MKNFIAAVLVVASTTPVLGQEVFTPQKGYPHQVDVECIEVQLREIFGVASNTIFDAIGVDVHDDSFGENGHVFGVIAWDESAQSGSDVHTLAQVFSMEGSIEINTWYYTSIVDDDSPSDFAQISHSTWINDFGVAEYQGIYGDTEALNFSGESLHHGVVDSVMSCFSFNLS